MQIFPNAATKQAWNNFASLESYLNSNQNQVVGIKTLIVADNWYQDILISCPYIKHLKKCHSHHSNGL